MFTMALRWPSLHDGSTLPVDEAALSASGSGVVGGEVRTGGVNGKWIGSVQDNEALFAGPSAQENGPREKNELVPSLLRSRHGAEGVLGLSGRDKTSLKRKQTGVPRSPEGTEASGYLFIIRLGMTNKKEYRKFNNYIHPLSYTSLVVSVRYTLVSSLHQNNKHFVIDYRNYRSTMSVRE